MRSPAVHSVHVYDGISSLVGRLCGITGSALKIGNAVLVVARPEVRDGLVHELSATGIDLRDHARKDLFSMYDAGAMLAQFMVEGRPDPDLFNQCIGSVLQQARKASRSKDGGLTVFGEMVAVLWAEGNRTGALELERLWNNALSQNVFHLHCGYPRSFLEDRTPDVQAVLAAHTHVLEDALPDGVADFCPFPALA